jgi:YD repeat-containing protein
MDAARFQHRPGHHPDRTRQRCFDSLTQNNFIQPRHFMNCTERIHQHPWPLKLVTWLVLGTQCLFPFQGQLLAASTVSVMPAASSFPAPVLTPKNVVVNRTVPKVQPPSTELRFSAVPTDGEIFAAHIFKEPIIPVGKIASPAENKDLTQALMDFRNRQDSDDAGAIENFLQAYPDSKWRISLLANLGSHYRHTMQFTKALAAWREMWALGRNVTDPDVKSVVDGAAAEMAQLLVTLGWSDELQALLKELNGRQLHGAAYVWIDDARLALIQMQKRPDRTFRCGPVALSHVSASLGLKNPANIQSIRAEMASTNGTSLAQNWLLSKRLGLNYQMAMRKRGAAIPLPCVVHWKQGHFSALTKMDNGRYLVEEGGFSQGWVSAQVLDEEASGYFLIPAGPLPAGWDAVTEQEGQNAWGRSAPERKNPKLPCCPPKGGGGGGEPCRNCGMAQYMVYTMMVALYVGDVPVGYTPPIGPAVEFRVNYNELDSSQPAVFPYSNLGRQWDYNWLAFVSDDTTQPDADVEIIFGESDETYTGFNTGSQTYAVQQYDQTRLIKTSDTSYERRYPDGSMEIYSFPDSTNGPRRVFLTRKLDPAGNALTFTYDSSNRLVSVQDAIGQVTTLSYELAGDPLKITKVTDPFGRYATFQYNSTNNTAQLTNITDVIGISSSFTYGSPSGETDFINSMTTPYGTTTFTNNGASSTNISGAGRQIDITDPLGAKERFEFSTPNAGQIQDIPDNLIPAGVNSRHLNSYIDSRTTFYWDRKAMQDYPGDYSKAKKYVWLMEQNDDEVVSSTLECVINPLESPVFYAYPGQSYYAYYAGTLATPTAIARVLDDGTTQLQQYQYNSIGRPTNSVDPIGRTTLYTYATNNFDLLAVSRLAASQTNMLARLTYNSQHRPLTYVDASGQTTYLGYNTNGQLTALTNALAQVITLAYDTNNYLTNISGALPYAPISAAYDGFGRVRTVTDSEGYSVTYDYDAADRPTKVTYPDGTYEQITYKNLDPVLGRDRMGRWTAATYNAQRQLTAIEDALGRLTSFERCGCGALDSFTDPLGRTTTFVRDVQKRVTTKIYPNGTQLNYAYENNTSRLKSVTDAKNQTRAYSYYNDNNLKQVTYSNAVIATPSVSLTYDTNYNRLLTMSDGIGTTTYGYNPISATPTLGAGQLASVTNPWPNSVVTYNYDALGRATNRAINGVAQTVAFDNLGRVTLVTNVLGSFTNVYVRATGMIATNLYPNGQKTVFGYYGTNNDERLQQIQNLTPGGQNLSTFGYVYDANGEITNWTEQADNNTPTVQVEEYDPVNQLLSSTIHSGTIKCGNQ